MLEELSKVVEAGAATLCQLSLFRSAFRACGTGFNLGDKYLNASETPSAVEYIDAIPRGGGEDVFSVDSVEFLLGGRGYFRLISDRFGSFILSGSLLPQVPERRRINATCLGHPRRKYS